MSKLESRDKSNDSTELTSRRPGEQAKSKGIPPLDLEKLSQVVDEIMSWRHKATECCGTDSLLAGRFQVIDELGSGGIVGAVYRAIDQHAPSMASDGARKPIALKILSLVPDEETSGARYPMSPGKWESIEGLITELAIQEAASDIVGCIPMKICDTPNPIDGLDAMLTYVQRSPIWFSMPVAKCNLSAHLKSKGQLPFEEAVNIMEQVAGALKGLHSYGQDGGIIHRDLKPQNILQLHGDKWVVSDFGLSVRGFNQRVYGNNISGTEAYMSPEQLDGQTLTAESDIWSWGVVFYQLVSGTLPFGGPDMFNHIRAAKFPSLSQMAPNCPSWLVKVIHRCLRKEGKPGYDSFRDILQSIEDGFRRNVSHASEVPHTVDSFSQPFLRTRVDVVKNTLDSVLAFVDGTKEKIKLPHGTEIGVTLNDVISSAKLLSESSTPLLNYDAYAMQAYYSETPNWLTYDGPFGKVVVPYVVVADYTNSPSPKNWGGVLCVEPYEFPRVLETHRAEMVRRLEMEGKLPKGNRPCPRVHDAQVTESGALNLTVQKAHYFDQVGTNLSLDFPFSTATLAQVDNSKTIRDWDMKHGSGKGLLPNLKDSLLANTIGVAVGVTAIDQFGQRQILKRLRHKKVAVYANQWHVPFSFALAWPEGLDPGETMTLSEFIRRDYGHELAEELPGLEPDEFEPPRMLAFCRDMVRGGKPQFFFEIRSRLSVDELQRKIKSDDAEFRDESDVVVEVQPGLSSELLAFVVLVGLPAQRTA